MAKFYFLALALILPSALFAQTSLSGSVIDDTDKTPLIGATISNSGDSLLAITNEDGDFQLEIKGGQLLIVRHVGFESMEVPVKAGEGNIVIALTRDTELLQEVKIEAYESYRPVNEVAGSIGIIRKQ